MLEETLLCGLVVVGSDGENPIHTEPGQLARNGDDFSGVVAAGAREDGDVWIGGRRAINGRFSRRTAEAPGQLDGDLGDAKVLFPGERGALPGRSARDEEVNVCVDLPLDQLTQG